MRVDNLRIAVRKVKKCVYVWWQNLDQYGHFCAIFMFVKNQMLTLLSTKPTDMKSKGTQIKYSIGNQMDWREIISHSQ